MFPPSHALINDASAGNLKKSKIRKLKININIKIKIKIKNIKNIKKTEKIFAQLADSVKEK